MRYLELIADRPLVWALFGIYMVVTSWLAWLGHRKTKDMASFAIGGGDMAPVVVGITLAASIASTATFVINPGFVYVHGISALIHLGAAAGLGVVLGLFSMSVGFRRVGARTGALTLPHWLGGRYGSRVIATLFAGISMLSLCFVVLIVGGLSIIMQQTLGLTNVESLVVIIAFVFGYVFIGGAYAHAYTNTLQGIMMAAVALIIVGSGIHHLFDGSSIAAMNAIDPNLTRTVNPHSPLFNDYFTVYISGIVIGFALVCQPHIMTKALYVKTDRDVWKYLGVATVVSLLFSALLLVGLYAHGAGMHRSAFVDPATGAFRQDRVMAVYIAHTFSPTLVAIITVAILAAGMSTLDGILVSLASITANDLIGNLAHKRLARMDEARRSRLTHHLSQLVLVAMGVTAFVISLSPPKLLGIFGQIGVYGIVAASTVPILFGILFPSLRRTTALAAALTGLGLHFGLYFGHVSANPGATATWAILGSGAVAGIALLATAIRNRLAARANRSAALLTRTPAGA